MRKPRAFSNREPRLSRAGAAPARAESRCGLREGTSVKETRSEAAMAEAMTMASGR